jgi:osmotically-inducible protein OsmY
MISITYHHFVVMGLAVILCGSSFADDQKEIPDAGSANATRTPIGRATVNREDAPDGARVIEQIRNALSSDEKLSASGRNVKLIATPEGRVTLEGAVRSADEKNKIAFLAAKIAGPGMVENQLSIRVPK